MPMFTIKLLCIISSKLFSIEHHLEPHPLSPYLYFKCKSKKSFTYSQLNII